MNIVLSTVMLSMLWHVELIQLQPILTFEEVPDDAPEVLRWPAGVTIDEQGQVYVLDLTAHTVFSWDKKGQYRGNIGRKGEGPGEFQFFAQVGGPQGYISSHGNEVFVYAGGNKFVHVFGTDMTFKRKFAFQIVNGRVESLVALAPDRYLAFCSSYFGDEPFRQVGLFDEGGTMVKELAKVKDTTWTLGKDGQKVILHCYTPSLVTHYDARMKRILMGDATKPVMDLVDHRGAVHSHVKATLARLPITEEDKQDFLEMPFIKNSEQLVPTFGDFHGYYNALLPLGDQGFLWINQILGDNRVKGFLVSPEGKALGRIKMTLGSTGGLFGARQRIIGVSTNADEEIIIQEWGLSRNAVITRAAQ